LKTLLYEPRFYRRWLTTNDLVAFNVTVKETDLSIRANSNLKEKALVSVIHYRMIIEGYINSHPIFLTTLKPYIVEEDAPIIVKEMAKAGGLVSVGPMASVAGAIAEYVGRFLLSYTEEIIVENGGDIFLKISRPRLVGIYAGSSPFTGKIAIEIQPDDTPLGIGTSSGTVGHSLSFGTADAAIVLSPSATLADAAATAVANRIKDINDIASAIEWAQKIPGLIGVVTIRGDKIGIWGKARIVTVT